MNNTMNMNVYLFGQYPDFLVFGLCISITVFLIIGVKESTLLNSIFTLFNIVCILFILITGATKANFSNWNLKPDENTTFLDIDGNNVSCSSEDLDCGKGGFLPYGFNGIIKGSSICFYAFIGFDCIATTGEEVRNAKRTIPIAIIITLTVVACSYLSVSAILTLMMPYYALDQDQPFTMAFNYVGLNWATYVVNIGAIISLTTCLYASMFPMPRVVYSLASDGLIFKWMAWIAPRLSTPTAACLFTGFFSAVCTLMFNLSQLIDMLSIGTLLAYTLVSSCTLILRYRPFVYEERIKRSKKSNFLTVLIGDSDDEPFVQRLFYPKSKCSRSTAQLVNFLGVTASKINLIFNYIVCVLNLNEFHFA
jgi:amino acid transporter